MDPKHTLDEHFSAVLQTRVFSGPLIDAVGGLFKLKAFPILQIPPKTLLAKYAKYDRGGSITTDEGFYDDGRKRRLVFVFRTHNRVFDYFGTFPTSLLSAPVMRGIDDVGRPFIALKIVVHEKHPVSDLVKKQIYLQILHPLHRHSTSHNDWTSSGRRWNEEDEVPNKTQIIYQWDGGMSSEDFDRITRLFRAEPLGYPIYSNSLPLCQLTITESDRQLPDGTSYISLVKARKKRPRSSSPS